MVSYGRWLLSRGQTTGVISFESYEPVVISLYKASISTNFASKYGRVVAYQRLNTIEKFKSPALKVVAVAYERFRCFGRLGGLVAHGGSTV